MNMVDIDVMDSRLVIYTFFKNYFEYNLISFVSRKYEDEQRATFAKLEEKGQKEKAKLVR